MICEGNLSYGTENGLRQSRGCNFNSRDFIRDYREPLSTVPPLPSSTITIQKQTLPASRSDAVQETASESVAGSGSASLLSRILSACQMESQQVRGSASGSLPSTWPDANWGWRSLAKPPHLWVSHYGIRPRGV
jgi:hypothetical protein